MIPRIMLEYPRIRGPAQVLHWGLVHLNADKGEEGLLPDRGGRTERGESAGRLLVRNEALKNLLGIVTDNACQREGFCVHLSQRRW